MSFSSSQTVKNEPIHMQSSFDEFVDDLPNKEDTFDINGDLSPAESQTENQEESVVAEPSSEGVNTQNEEDLPFNKNPKVKKYIERQVQKHLEKMSPQKTQQEVFENKTTEVPSEWIAMYGDNEDTRKAWTYQKKLLDDVKSQAIQEARESLRQERLLEQQQTERWENFIDTSLEEIEEQYNVDLTSNTPQARKSRAEFLDLVQRLSPKDESGKVSNFVDFNETFQIYQARKAVPKTDTSLKKTLASRGMTKSTEAPIPQEGYEPGMGFNGIRQKLGLD